MLSSPNTTITPQKGGLNVSTLEKLKKFAYKPAAPETTVQDVEIAKEKAVVAKPKLSSIEELARCGKRLSQMSRASQSSATQSPVLQKILNPQLIDDDDDVDFSLPF